MLPFYSQNDVPPVPKRNVSMAAVRGAVRSSITEFPLLQCSHSHNDVLPEPQRNVSIAAVRGVVRPSKLLNFPLVAVIYIRGTTHHLSKGVAGQLTLIIILSIIVFLKYELCINLVHIKMCFLPKIATL